MATKAQIIAYITSKLTGLGSTKTTRAEHENLLYNNVSSVLEGGYATPTSEDSEGTHAITTPNANFTYIATFSKVFRNITFSGSLFCVTTVSAGSNIFIIDPTVTDFLGSGLAYGVATNSNTGETIEIRMNDSYFQTNSTIIAGERFRFTITYRALN